MHLQSLDQDSRDLLLDAFVDLREHVNEDVRVEIGLRVDVSQLIHKAVKEAGSGFR